MFDFLFNPSGRISRKGYGIGFFLPYFLLGLLPGIVLVKDGMALTAYLFVVGLFFLWPSVIAVPFKRFHDFGKSGWWHVGIILTGFALSIFASSDIIMAAFNDPDSLEGLATERATGWETTLMTWRLVADDPLKVGALILATILPYGEMLFFLLVPGEKGANRFGEDPLVGGRGFAD